MSIVSIDMFHEPNLSISNVCTNSYLFMSSVSILLSLVSPPFSGRSVLEEN